MSGHEMRRLAAHLTGLITQAKDPGGARARVRVDEVVPGVVRGAVELPPPVQAAPAPSWWGMHHQRCLVHDRACDDGHTCMTCDGWDSGNGVLGTCSRNATGRALYMRAHDAACSWWRGRIIAEASR